MTVLLAILQHPAGVTILLILVLLMSWTFLGEWDSF